MHRREANSSQQYFCIFILYNRQLNSDPCLLYSFGVENRLHVGICVNLFWHTMLCTVSSQEWKKYCETIAYLSIQQKGAQEKVVVALKCTKVFISKKKFFFFYCDITLMSCFHIKSNIYYLSNITLSNCANKTLIIIKY